MHARHRNGPGNGYRSNVMGMGGMAPASRIPPEGAIRSQRMYNSDYRNYNRVGYASGGGHSKQFQPAVPPPSRGPDIFMEAGRLAAEYLVSKGVLPPNALSGKWQNDSFKNLSNFQGFRSHEVEITGDGRRSVHSSRLGNAGLDVGPGRRRYSDDHNSIGSRSSARERKRIGALKNYGLEVNRESGHTGSLAGKFNASQDMNVDSRDEWLVDKDGKGGTLNLSPGEITREVDCEARVESRLEKSKLVEDGEHMKNCDDGDKFNNEDEVVKQRINDDDDDVLQQKDEENKVVVTGSVREDGLASETGDHADLVRHSKFVNVPTRARSSLTIKTPKGDQAPMKQDENIYGRELPEGPGVHVIDVDIENSAGNDSSPQNSERKSHESDVPTVEKGTDVTNTTGSVYKEEPEADEVMSAFGRSHSMLMERGEKRPMDFYADVKEHAKKLRQWVPVLDTRHDGSTPISSSMENHSVDAHSTLSPDQRSLDISVFPKGQADSCEFIEEKQLFPGSFKTCDLNLVGNGDVSENRDAGRMLVFSTVMQTGKAETPIDVDLSISNNGNLPNNRNSKHVINGNDIEVIDLEKDSAPDEKTFSNPERRGDTVFTELDGFPNNANNGIPDVQDGYGLMISELLGHDSPNCSVPAELNSLHDHMDLPNTEGILGDDDSIYMSLGEIPLSLLGAWEQPTQDYGKPF